MRSRPSDAERGFSLVEVLVASTVLTVGLVALAQLFAAATASNLNARHLTYATVLAAQKLEELRAEAWGQETAQGDFDQVDTYQRRWSIEPIADPENHDPADVVAIRVAVAHVPATGSGEVRLAAIKIRQPE